MDSMLEPVHHEDEESSAFADHWGEIKGTLGVNIVFEWGDVNPEKAGREIAALVDIEDEVRWTELLASLIVTVQWYRPPRKTVLA